MKTKHVILIIVIIIGTYLAYKYLIVGPEISKKQISLKEKYKDLLQKKEDLNINILNKNFENLQMASTNKFEKIL